MKRLVSFAALVVLVGGCTEQEGDQPSAQSESIEVVSFAVDKLRVEAGDVVTVSWDVRNARDLELLANGVPVDLGGQSSGTALVTVHETTTLRLEARSKTSEVLHRMLVVEAKVSDLSPVILAFEASPGEVDADEVTTLSWITRNASSVSIFDGSGSQVPTGGGAAAEEGSVEVRLSEDGNYRLVATGDHGTTERSLFIKVRGSPDAELLLSKANVVAGEPVTLSWKVKDAARVLIREVGGKVLVDSDVSFEGAFDVTPQQSTTYELRATGSWRDGVRTATVEVNPELLIFEVMEKGQIGVGKLATLHWVTKGAVELRLSNLQGFEETITGFRVAEGTARVPMGTNGKFRLEARGADGKGVELETGAEVLGLPSIGSFTVTPDLTSQLATPVRVQVAWDGVANADELTLVGDVIGRVGIFRAPFDEGTLELWLRQTNNLTLTARNGAGETTRLVTATLVPLPLIRSFIPFPKHAGVGETIQLSWDIDGSESIEVYFNGAPVLVDPTMGTGSVPFTITQPGEFHLVATNSAGGTVERRQQVTMGSPEIRSFVIPETTLALGGLLHFSWTNLGGTQLTLFKDGAQVCQTNVAGEIEQGGCSLPGGKAERSSFKLRLENGLGEIVERTLSVLVTDGPIIQSFVPARPKHCNDGTVAVNWVVTNDASGNPPVLTLTDTLGNTYDVSAANPNAGSFRVPFTALGTQEFILQAHSPNTMTDQKSLYIEMVEETQFNSVSVSPQVVSAGQPVTLTWDALCADSVTVNRGALVGAAASDSFVDVQSTGTFQSCTGSTDECVTTFTFPSNFSFPFSGQDRTSARVQSNGWLGFDLTTTTSSPWTNETFPSAGKPWTHLAPFWDDLQLQAGHQGFYQKLHTEQGRQGLIVQWKAQECCTSGFDLNFQTIMWEDGTFDYRYGTMTPTSNGRVNGNSATIGYQNLTRTEFHQISHNTAVAGGMQGKSYRYRFQPRPVSGSMVIHPTSTQTIQLQATGLTKAEASIEIVVQ